MRSICAGATFVVACCCALGGYPAAAGEPGGYEPVQSWNAERIREILATQSVDVIVIGDSWAVGNLRARPLQTLVREVDWSAAGGLNGIFLGPATASVSDAGPYYRVQTALSTTRALGMATGDYRFVREKYEQLPLFNGIPGGALEGRVEPASVLNGHAGYVRVRIEPAALDGINFVDHGIGTLGDTTLFRFVLLAQPEVELDCVREVESGTAAQYGGGLTEHDLHALVSAQEAGPMEEFRVDTVAPPFESALTMTLWPPDNQLPSGNPVQYISLRQCGILAADENGAPAPSGVTIRALADPSYQLASLADDQESTQQQQKRYTTAQLRAWLKATRVRDHALVLVHFAVEDLSPASMRQTLATALDRLEEVLPESGYQSFCVVPFAMAHMVAGETYDVSMTRALEWNGAFLAEARARPATVAYLNLVSLAGGFMLVDGWRGFGDEQGETIPPDNQQLWQQWLRDHGYDQFALWDGTIVDLSALPTFFESARIHLNGMPAATFFYRALWWAEAQYGVTNPALLTTLTMIRGSVISGGIEDLRESDDARLRTRSVFGFTALEPNIMELRLEAESESASASSIAVRIESRAAAVGASARVRLRNWGTGGLETIAVFPLAQSERNHVIDGIPGSPYVRDSAEADLELSLRHSAIVTFSAAGFDSYLDCIKVGVRPPE
jgi:hypothetical protein